MKFLKSQRCTLGLFAGNSVSPLLSKDIGETGTPEEEVSACSSETASSASRLRATRGESITETLVSVLIGGLALLLLAVAVASSVRMVADSRATMEDYYTQSNSIAEMAGGSAVSGTVTLQDASGNDVVIKAGESAGKKVTYYESEILPGRPVVSYWVSE